MRRLIPVFACLVLLAACTGSAATPTATPAIVTAPPTAPPSATAAPSSASVTPTASPSSAPATGLVTYDGKACTYTGPTVLPEGTALQIQFAPTAETYTLSWTPALHGATLAQIKQDDGAALGPDYGDSLMPAWSLGSQAHSSFGSGTIPLGLRIYTDNGKSYDALVIACAKSSPSKSDPTAFNLLDLTTAALVSIMPR